ncbi:hypothetical protein BGX33_012533 [Mortierella sp. NVP41]|nr:hypothetical protein BGX33_012533 [Mortierella sp. NVP41]
MASPSIPPRIYLHKEIIAVQDKISQNPAGTRVEVPFTWSYRPNTSQRAKLVFPLTGSYVYTTKTSKFLKNHLSSIQKGDLLQVTGDVVCNAFFIEGNLIYSPTITPENIKIHKSEGPIIDLTNVVKKTWTRKPKDDTDMEKEIARRMKEAEARYQPISKRAASSEIAHEALKKIASDRETSLTHDVDEVVEIPMDPTQDTAEDALNLQMAIRQSIASMNLAGGLSQADESSSSVPTEEIAETRRSSLASFFSKGQATSSTYPPTEESRRPSLGSLLASEVPQGTQSPPVEEEEALTRKKPTSRTHLRFQNPLSSSNPPGKKKRGTAQAQQMQDQPEQGPSTSVEPSTAPKPKKATKAKKPNR